MKVATFVEWQETQRIDLAGKTIDCPVCEGTGNNETECECCGQDWDRECECCDGACSVEFDQMMPRDQQLLLNKRAYDRALLVDMTKLANWRGRSVFEELIDNGFSIACRISNRQLMVEACA